MDLKEAVIELLGEGDQTRKQILARLDTRLDDVINELLNERKVKYVSKRHHLRLVTYKTVRNLLSGKELEIESDTPLCCDPSSETYWSM